MPHLSCNNEANRGPTATWQIEAEEAVTEKSVQQDQLPSNSTTQHDPLTLNSTPVNHLSKARLCLPLSLQVGCKSVCSNKNGITAAPLEAPGRPRHPFPRHSPLTARGDGTVGGITSTVFLRWNGVINVSGPSSFKKALRIYGWDAEIVYHGEVEDVSQYQCVLAWSDAIPCRWRDSEVTFAVRKATRYCNIGAPCSGFLFLSK